MRGSRKTFFSPPSSAWVPDCCQTAQPRTAGYLHREPERLEGAANLGDTCAICIGLGVKENPGAVLPQPGPKFMLERYTHGCRLYGNGAVLQCGKGQTQPTSRWPGCWAVR